MTPVEIVSIVVDQGRSVMTRPGTAPTTFDAMEQTLRTRRCRVLRAPDLPITLPHLLASLSGRSDGAPPGPEDLEAGYEQLTVLDPLSDRIVLVAPDTDGLDPAVLRYLQLAMHDAPLQLVLGCSQTILSLLAMDEFAPLRRRVVEPQERRVARPPISQPPERPQSGPLRWLAAAIAIALAVSAGLWAAIHVLR